jgi:hypothetical protein
MLVLNAALDWHSVKFRSHSTTELTTDEKIRETVNEPRGTVGPTAPVSFRR